MLQEQLHIATTPQVMHACLAGKTFSHTVESLYSKSQGMLKSIHYTVRVQTFADADFPILCGFHFRRSPFNPTFY